MSIMMIASVTIATPIPLNNNKYENFQFFDTEPKKDYKSTNEYTFEKIGYAVFK